MVEDIRTFARDPAATIDVEELRDTGLEKLGHGIPSRGWNMLLEDFILAEDLEGVISLLESLAAATIAIREYRFTHEGRDAKT